MVKIIPNTEAQAERFFPKNPMEKVLGTEEEKRSTKSWIPTLPLSFALSVLEEYAHDSQGQLAELELADYVEAHKEPGHACTLTTCPKGTSVGFQATDWDGPRNYQSIHKKLLEHFVSHDGHSLKFAIRYDELRQQAEQRAQESAQEAAAGKPQ